TVDRNSLFLLRTAPPGVDGSIAATCHHRIRLRTHRTWRLWRNRDALPEQCNLSRSGRCSDRHASPLGVEHHQPHSRSVSYLRTWTISKTGRNGRGISDVHWPQHRCTIPVLSIIEGHGTNSCAGPAYSPSS